MKKYKKLKMGEFKILVQIKGGFLFLFDEEIEGDGMSVIGDDKIIKVKRISDGVVFALGSTITSEPFVKDRKFTVIDKIYYNEHNQLSYSTKEGRLPRTFVFNDTTVTYETHF